MKLFAGLKGSAYEGLLVSGCDVTVAIGGGPAELLQKFGNYGPARVRGDGDIQIPLDFDLKKARSRRSNLASAFSEMMSDDLGPKRSSTWIK